mgnify:CR=1 FL=1
MDHLAEWVWYSFHPQGVQMTEAEHFEEAEKILARCDLNGDRSIDREVCGVSPPPHLTAWMVQRDFSYASCQTNWETPAPAPRTLMLLVCPVYFF